jgi:CPA1 family monovalent cation:H+ antiporter
VFTLIGLQLPAIVQDLGDQPLAQLLVWAAILTAAVIAIRFMWVFPATWLPRRLVPGLSKRDPMPPVGAIVVLGWTGMRGIVSLAAALALPLTLADGKPFAERPLLIFLTYGVLLLTLVIPTVTLPPLLRFLKLEDRDERKDDEVKARIAMSRVAAGRVAQLSGRKSFNDELLGDLGRRYQRQIDRLAPNLESMPYSALDPLEQQRRALLLELLESERGVLHDLRSHGELYEEVYHQLGEELDLESLRVRRNMRPL